MPLRARLPVAVAILPALIAPGIAHAAVDAHGSSKQGDAASLKSKAQVSLLDGKGRKVATKRADGLGGVLFRNVKPGTGYRIRPGGGSQSGPLTVISNRPPPPSPDVYTKPPPRAGTAT